MQDGEKGAAREAARGSKRVEQEGAGEQEGRAGGRGSLGEEGGQ